MIDVSLMVFINHTHDVINYFHCVQAWHSSGTYDKMSKDGGSGRGTIRFKEELVHGGNAGLDTTAVVWMEDVKKKYGDSLSYADLYTLGGGK